MAHADPSSELATKPLGRLLLRFAIPSIFAQIVNLLYNIVDRIFVGRIPEIGPLALAGLGVAFPIILIISSFSFLAGMGGAPLASIAMGRGDNAKAERILGSACVFLLGTEIGKIVAVDVLLTETRRQCLGAGIRPTFFVDGSRLGFINDFDLCTLIGNAADNAIEATSQLPLGEARESSWCPCRPRLESARGSELPRALPLEARVHLMARRVVGGGGGEHGLLGCRSLRPINFTPSGHPRLRAAASHKLGLCD